MTARPLRLHDSMRREKVPFEPLVPGKVGMYVCGPTPYAAAHIGHAYAAISFDTIRRALRFLGYEESSLPETERAARENQALPLWAGIGADVQERVVETVRAAAAVKVP